MLSSQLPIRCRQTMGLTNRLDREEEERGGMTMGLSCAATAWALVLRLISHWELKFAQLLL